MKIKKNTKLTKVNENKKVVLPKRKMTREENIRFNEIMETAKTLTPNARKFCELYTSSKEFFGNGLESYIEAYNPKQIGNWHNSAKSTASQLLTRKSTLSYINQLLDFKSLNDIHVDKQLGLVITQNVDLRAKMLAIKEYNLLKSRINRRVDIQVRGAIAHGHFYKEDEKIEEEILLKYKANIQQRLIKEKQNATTGEILRDTPLAQDETNSQ